jgi:fatty acid desaturase
MSRKLLVFVPFICIIAYLSGMFINFGDFNDWDWFVSEIGNIMEDLEKLLLGFALYYLRSVFVYYILKLRKPPNLKVTDLDKEKVKHKVAIKNYSMKIIYKILILAVGAWIMLENGLGRVNSTYQKSGLAEELRQVFPDVSKNPQYHFTHEQVLLGLWLVYCIICEDKWRPKATKWLLLKRIGLFVCLNGFLAKILYSLLWKTGNWWGFIQQWMICPFLLYLYLFVHHYKDNATMWFWNTVATILINFGYIVIIKIYVWIVGSKNVTNLYVKVTAEKYVDSYVWLTVSYFILVVAKG